MTKWFKQLDLKLSMGDLELPDPNTNQRRHGSLMPQRGVMLLALLAVLHSFSSPCRAQQVRVDFVQEFVGRTIDMAVDVHNHVYLLNTDALITVVDTLRATRNIQVSQNVDKPGCLAVDAYGNIYVGDKAKAQVVKFDSNGQMLTHFGPSANEPEALSHPEAIATDHFNRVFVADSKGLVHIFNNQGVYLGRLAGLDHPVDVGIDRCGNLYVLETEEPAISIFDANQKLINRIVPGSNTGFSLVSPGGMFVESDGTVYVTDLDHCRVSVIGSLHETDSQPALYTQLGTKGEGRGEFRKPIAAAVDKDGNLFVADSKNRNVQVFSLTGLVDAKTDLILPRLDSVPLTVEWMGTIDHSNTTQSGGLKSFGLDDQSNFYCLDAEMSSISVYGPDGRFSMSFGKKGDEPARMSHPVGVALDSGGFLYVVDSGNHRVQQWSRTGVFQNQFGKKGKSQTKFNSPSGIAIDSDGNLVIADTDNNRIKILGTDGQVEAILGELEKEKLHKPISVATSTGGKLYAVEQGRRTVRVFNTDSTGLSFIDDEEGKKLFYQPVSIDVDRNDNVYVLDAKIGVFVFDPESHLISHFASGGDLSGQFLSPTEIRIGPDEQIYISDSEHNRITIFRLIGRSSGIIAGRVEPKPSSGRVTLLRECQLFAADTLFCDGSFFLRDLPPGKYSVTVEAKGYTQLSKPTVEVTAGHIVRCDVIPLAANGAIRGVVLPKSQGARILLTKGDNSIAETVVNPEDGAYSFTDILPGEYEIEARAEGYSYLSASRRILIESGVVVKDTTLLKKSATISGMTIPAGARVTGMVFQDTLLITRFVADPDSGFFEVSGFHPGTYHFVLSAKNYVDLRVPEVRAEEDERLDLGILELERVRITTPEARQLVAEGKRLHLAAGFGEAQDVFLDAITNQEMADWDLAEAYLWLAYSYFPFSAKKDQEREALIKSFELDSTIVLDDSFSPAFLRDFEAMRDSVFNLTRNDHDR